MIETIAWIAGIVAVLVVVGFAVDRLATRLESNGLIYWRHSKPRRGSSLGLLESIYDPSIVHTIEEEISEQTKADQAESGEET